MFSHGGALRLDVECLECELTDLGADDLGAGDLGRGDRAVGRARREPDLSTWRAFRRRSGAITPDSVSGSQGLTAICRRAIEQGPSPTVPAGKPPCPFVSTRSSADFAQQFKAFLATKREVSADIEARHPRHRRRRGRARRRGADRGDRASSTGSTLDAGGLRVTPAEIDAAVDGLRRRDRSTR